MAKWVMDKWNDGREDDDVAGEETSWMSPRPWSKWDYRPVTSTSAYLRGGFSKHTFFDSKKNQEKETLLDVLWEVNKTSNLIANSAGDGNGEKRLTVKFSDGTNINSFETNVLYISPAVLKNDTGQVHKAESDEFFAATDALNGQVLLCSYMHRHVSKALGKRFAKLQMLDAQNIFLTDLQQVSIAEIAKEWPGFQSYVDQVKQTFFADKSQIFRAFGDPAKLAENLISMLCYNVLNEDQIEFSQYFDDPDFVDRLNKAQEYVTKTLNESVSDAKRLDRAIELRNTVHDMLQLHTLPPESMMPQPGGNQTGGDEKDDDTQQGGGQQGQGDIPQQEQEQEQDDQGDTDQNQQNNAQGGNTLSHSGESQSTPEQRPFVGDQSYDPNRIIDGDRDAAQLKPQREEGEKKSVTKNDSLANIKNPLLEGVFYKRIEPAFKPSMVDDYNLLVRENRSVIRAVQSCFSFRNTECSMSTYGLPSGNLDDNSLFKVKLDDFDRLYERKTLKARKSWLVSLLIDQSGSMDGYKIHEANKLAIIFAEALKAIREVDYSVYGWASLHNESEIGAIVYKEKNYSNMHALTVGGTRCGTPLGFSCGHIADKMITQYREAQNKVMFVLTDGEPTTHNWNYPDAVEHSRMAINLVRQQGISVFGVGICNAFSEARGRDIFGAQNFVVIDDVKTCLNVLVASLTKFMKRLG